jgi:hypothetical protein
MRREAARLGAVGVFLVSATACPGECVGDACDGSSIPAEICGNTLDDDSDSARDCEDPDCDCSEADCTDGRDDDADGRTDCDDEDCEFEAVCIEADCADGLDDDGDGAVDCDDWDCRDAWCPWEPAYYAVEGGFAWDAATNALSVAEDRGWPLPPYVAIWLYDEEYLDGSWACYVMFEHAGSAPPELITLTDEAEGLAHLGFVMTPSSPDWVVSTTCADDPDHPLDPEGVLGTDDATAWATARFTEIGVGVGQETLEVDALLDELTTGDERPWYGGGGQWLDSGGGAVYEASAFTLAIELDESMNVVLEDGVYVPILADSYDAGVVHGFFTVWSTTVVPL